MAMLWFSLHIRGKLGLTQPLHPEKESVSRRFFYTQDEGSDDTVES